MRGGIFTANFYCQMGGQKQVLLPILLPQVVEMSRNDLKETKKKDCKTLGITVFCD